MQCCSFAVASQTAPRPKAHGRTRSRRKALVKPGPLSATPLHSLCRCITTNIHPRQRIRKNHTARWEVDMHLAESRPVCPVAVEHVRLFYPPGFNERRAVDLQADWGTLQLGRPKRRWTAHSRACVMRPAMPGRHCQLLSYRFRELGRIKGRTGVQVPQTLLAPRRVKRGEEAERAHEAYVGCKAVLLDVTLCAARKHPAEFNVMHARIV